MLTTILITTLIIMVIVAVFIGILYLFERFVTPIGSPLKGILIFILAAILIIYAVQNHGIALW